MYLQSISIIHIVLGTDIVVDVADGSGGDGEITI